ncbi:hypothetical protein OEA41_009605 [Lepraria neglecta]|uniref:Uncharacterized protein n=1 Tax=Lepraria neglecta TaxID=209136 RepID=A0AAD9Z1Z8_9LECA|nr:hypothetical protein OEA41_009605 [Lepraria neglecta]
MAAGKTAQAHRKTTKRPPSYYKNLRQELAAKDRTAPKHADNTKKSKASLLKKWSRYTDGFVFGCRPVSMFDTRIKFEDEDNARKPADHPTVASNSEDHSDDPMDRDTPNDLDLYDKQATPVNSGSNLDHDGDASACRDDDSDTDSDSDSDSGTHDGADAGLDDTGSLL